MIFHLLILHSDIVLIKQIQIRTKSDNTRGLIIREWLKFGVALFKIM